MFFEWKEIREKYLYYTYINTSYLPNKLNYCIRPITKFTWMGMDIYWNSVEYIDIGVTRTNTTYFCNMFIHFQFLFV